MSLADLYIAQVLQRHLVHRGPFSPAERAVGQVQPAIGRWAGSALKSIAPSGSYAKETGVLGSADVDVFISLWTTTPLRDLYEGLFAIAHANGWNPRRQNVSVGATVGGTKVDLVPARVQSGYKVWHSLYRSKADTWTQTNVSEHIAFVRDSGRREEIRAMKLWRNRHSLEFPSFYLELVTIEALKYRRPGLADNVKEVFRWMEQNLVATTFLDPANTNNVISNDLTAQQKSVLAGAARRALLASSWAEVVG